MSLKSIKIIVLLLVAGVLAACAATEPADISGPDSGTTGLSDTGSIVGTGQDSGDDGTLSLVDSRLQALLDQTTVYFDYDESALTEQAQNLITAHAEYLNDHPSLSILLEGHADERGTREYNLALGDRRAEAVNLFLQALGVNQSRITSVSLGEEVPAVIGSDEETWALNRRVQIIY